MGKNSVERKRERRRERERDRDRGRAQCVQTYGKGEAYGGFEKKQMV